MNALSRVAFSLLACGLAAGLLQSRPDAAACLATPSSSVLNLSAPFVCANKRCPLAGETGCPAQTGTYCATAIVQGGEHTCETKLCPGQGGG